MTRDAQEVVKDLQTCLATKIGQDRFDLWLGKQVCFEWDNPRLVVRVPDQFTLERLRKQFRTEILSVARDLLQVDLSLDFQLDPSRKAKPTPPPQVDPQPESEPRVNDEVSLRLVTPAGRPPRSESDRPRSLDTLVVGEANRVAATAARSICQRPGSVSPFFLYGPPGTGKTHLAEAICATIRQNVGLRRVLSLSAEQFTSHFLGALQGSGLPSFRRKCRDVDVLAIDGIQFFAGKRATVVELQNTIDALLRQGKQLILTADRPPHELDNLGPELITRITGGLVCGVELADYEMRLGIARHMSVRCQRPVPEPVLQLLAAELPGDARRISGAMLRLEASSEALNQAITVDFARTALADLFRATLPIVRLADIERAVCQAFDLNAKSLKEGGKAKSSSHPRMLAMWLARKYTRAAFSEISEYFGRRSHSTVISAERKVNRWVSDGAKVQFGQATCNVEEAIRRIELQLRTG